MAKKKKIERHISPITIAAFVVTPLIFVFMPWVIQQAPINTLSNKQTSMVLPATALLPISKNLPIPFTSARNIFIIDRDSKMVLYSKNADMHVYPASTTKMMTALVTLERYPLDRVITVTRAYPIGENIGFQPGEKITVEHLLYALLVQSGNDAGEILAENFAGGRAAFVEAMNKKAAEIHLDNTHFANPTGIDEEGHYSTAVDLARLGDVALRNPEFTKIVGTQNAVVSSVDYSVSHVLSNINELLGQVAGVTGIKTGYTEGAGQSLVTLVSRNNHPVISVVLGSLDRFGDSRRLIEWVYDNFTWTSLAPQNLP